MFWLAKLSASCEQNLNKSGNADLCNRRIAPYARLESLKICAKFFCRKIAAPIEFNYVRVDLYFVGTQSRVSLDI